MPVVTSMTPGDRVSALVADRRRAESIGIVAILLVAGAAAFVVAARTGQLTWDEVVYASQAQSLVSDIPSVYWGSYRPPGLPLLGTLAALGGFSEISLRAITWALGFIALAITWAVARQLWGRWAALFTLLAAIGSPVVLGELRQFHNDLGSSGLLILLMGLLWDQFERRPAPTRLLLAAAPLAAAAFYLRYGTVLALAAIGVVAIVLWAPALRRHAGLVALTAALGALLLVPHVLEAVRVTGSPTGMLTQGAAAATKGNPLLTIVGFARRLPLAIAGPVGDDRAGHGWPARHRRGPRRLAPARLDGRPPTPHLDAPHGAPRGPRHGRRRESEPSLPRLPAAARPHLGRRGAGVGGPRDRALRPAVDPPKPRPTGRAGRGRCRARRVDRVRADESGGRRRPSRAAGGPQHRRGGDPCRRRRHVLPRLHESTDARVVFRLRGRPARPGAAAPDRRQHGTGHGLRGLPARRRHARGPRAGGRFRDMVQAGGWTRLESGSADIEIYRRDGAAQVPQANAK